MIEQNTITGKTATDISEKKFSREDIMRPAKIRKGKTRWNQCSEALASIETTILQGPILDFGCGVGYFILEGLARGLNVWGVDMLPGKIKRYQSLVDYSSRPVPWKSRCIIGDGADLPFSSDYFSAVTSWFVFEHIANPGEVLRELVRVVRPGGVILVRAQDARCNWEGHCKIPWIPFLRPKLARVWVDEFGKSFSLRDGVYDITQPQVISILETLGCSIVRQDKPLPPLDDIYLGCHSEEEVRKVARIVKKDLESGRFVPRQDGLYLIAQKNRGG